MTLPYGKHQGIGAYMKFAQESLVDTHHRSCVIEFALVIRCAPECDELPVREELVSVLDDLVSSDNKIHVVFL